MTNEQVLEVLNVVEQGTRQTIPLILNNPPGNAVMEDLWFDLRFGIGVLKKFHDADHAIPAPIREEVVRLRSEGDNLVLDNADSLLKIAKATTLDELGAALSPKADAIRTLAETMHSIVETGMRYLEVRSEPKLES